MKRLTQEEHSEYLAKNGITDATEQKRLWDIVRVRRAG